MPKKTKKNFWTYRPLLTETTPYELPLIFSNDKLYYAFCRRIEKDRVKELVFQLLAPQKPEFSIAYSYKIRKNSAKSTELGLIHPYAQQYFCIFYERYESSIIHYCNRSAFSLRHPSAIAAVYVESMDLEADRLKTGLVHLEPEENEPEISHLVSYFAYKKFNLLSKFHTSKEFIQLEKKFPKLRTLDISKCFYNIYTHTIAWATKDKAFAKQNKESHSFEAEFDALMQRANYNETNGIVVGPEVSRIFAEVILQAIDKNIENSLKEEDLREGEHYSIRRYVDDYAVFGHQQATLDLIEQVIRNELEKFKLHINESKVETLDRPFITTLTQAKSNTKGRLKKARKALQTEHWISEPLSSDEKNELLHLVNDLRKLIRHHNISPSSISSGVMADLRRLASIVNETVQPENEQSIENWSIAIEAILDCAFYITSVDLRVRTTYSLCQLLTQVTSHESAGLQEVIEHIKYRSTSELADVATIAELGRTSFKHSDCLELFNILICGAHVFGVQFLTHIKTKAILDALTKEELTYFKYITLKHCFLKEKTIFQENLKTLNEKALGILKDVNKQKLNQDSAIFHLFCDHLSAPDISASEKLSVYKAVFNGNPSKSDVEELSRIVGFTDWDGIAIEHTLQRRQLRPVYAVA